jgi:hypothetical protein
MEFRLSRGLSHELSFFSQWNSGYHEAFLTNFLSFFAMEFWLSRSLSHELSFFFPNGILAITKPFSRTFFLFSQWNSGYHEAFLVNFLSFFTMEFWLSRSLSHELSFFFHNGILKIRDLGEDSFYTCITKSIYIGSASLKTLPLDLEPPLQGKEYGPSYSNITMKKES